METNLFRIAQHIDTLATFSDRTGKGVTRFSYSPEDRKAKRYLHELFEQLELKVFTDAIGNIRARYEGQNPALAPLWIGSHIDSVKNGGKFDGVVGVVGAIEVVVYYASRESDRVGLLKPLYSWKRMAQIFLLL